MTLNTYSGGALDPPPLLTHQVNNALPNARATEYIDLGLEFLLALLQGLKPELPAMKLDTELVDITCDFNALRFVLFELML